MRDLTIIIPVHKINSEIEGLLAKAFKSIENLENNDTLKVMLVGPKEVLQKYESNVNENFILIENDETNLFTQINKGVSCCTTKFFSVLEFDDEYKTKWLTNVDKYIQYYNDTISVYMPISELSLPDNKVVSLINEISWASSFSDDLGFIDIESLQLYMEFNVTGSIIKTEDFIEVGGLKKSLKIASWYELLLRMVHNGKKVFVIPKVGYTHMIDRPDSYMNIEKEKISQEEGKWLIETAQKEYFYKEDRNILYQKQ